MQNCHGISSQCFAVAMCLSASGIGMNSASAQSYFATPSVVTYTQVAPSYYQAPQWPGQAYQPGQRVLMTHPTYMAASQPVVTSIQLVSASTPPQAPPPAPSFSPQAPPPTPNFAPEVPLPTPSQYNPWSGAPNSVLPPPEMPVYYHGVNCPECNETNGGQSCDWFCNLQKKLRSIYRASHRRSDCKFEYPVVTPSGSPYGYVEPTWNEFWIDGPPSPIGPGY